MLNKMRDLLGKITKTSVIDEASVKDIVKEIQRILISSDVNVKLVQQLSKTITDKALIEKLPPGVSRKEHLTKIIYEELIKILGGESYNPRTDKHKVLLVGLYGSGKTTTAGKLGLFYSKRGLKTAVLSTDSWRPAAYEQLKQVADRAKISFIGHKDKDAVKMLKSAMSEFQKYEVILVDSAGRDSLNEELLSELGHIKTELKPDEVFLVISADIGQSAFNLAAKFNEIVGLTGVIITKADSSGKAGGALSACSATRIPVTFIGTGEKLHDFELFDAKKYVSRLLGFPDLAGLIKKVKEAAEESDFNPEDLLKEEYTLKSFYKQLEATRKMGPLKKVMEMMGMSGMPEELAQTSEEKMISYKYIMNSMTPEELMNPDLIKASRVTRISKGSGRPESEVKELLKQFNMSKKMVQKLKKGKIRGLQNMFKQFKGVKF